MQDKTTLVEGNKIITEDNDVAEAMEIHYRDIVQKLGI